MASSSRSKSGRGRARARGAVIRRDGYRPWESLRNAIRSPTFTWAIVIWTVFTAIGAFVVVRGREHPMVGVGRVMDQTRIVRVPLVAEDLRRTESDRQQARRETPRVFVVERGVLDTVSNSLTNLPATLAGIESIDDLDTRLREEFRLTPQGFQALRAYAQEGVPSPLWEQHIRDVISAMEERPILESRDFQVAMQEGANTFIELVVGQDSRLVPRTAVVNLDDTQGVADAMDTIVRRRAGLTGPEAQVVMNRLIVDPAPTFRYDETATKLKLEQAAAAVEPSIQERRPGETIFRRGEVLTQAQLDVYSEELEEFSRAASPIRVWLHRIGVVFAVGLAALIGAVYAAVYSARIRKNPTRMWALAGLMLGLLALGVWGASLEPRLIALTVTAPVLLLAVTLSIAYDRPLAMGLAALEAVLLVIATQRGFGLWLACVLGIAAALWQLGEVRDRRTLVRMGLVAGLAVSVGVAIATLLDRPLVPEQTTQALADMGWVFLGGLAVGAITLSALPIVERAFDVTTSMTLIELRDPKHPLLRQLQQLAPGTYNHSLNVASIAEAAANAVGAYGLLTYVGGLYHDIGKMNKPEYFVENQSGGPNRHDRLSPQMSVLVIVGHVKDGMGLAREFGLPRVVQHFIEAHHGSTLVEFFYHRAKTQAEEDDSASKPKEVEFRYPGPKPRTKEVAILMLADAVESATRSMAEPTPSRIDALVREIANKRLLDGQFDECDLTLKELQLIVDSISKTVASIYHGRIVYPSGEKKPAEPPAEPPAEQRA